MPEATALAMRQRARPIVQDPVVQDPIVQDLIVQDPIVDEPIAAVAQRSVPVPATGLRRDSVSRADGWRGSQDERALALAVVHAMPPGAIPVAASPGLVTAAGERSVLATPHVASPDVVMPVVPIPVVAAFAAPVSAVVARRRLAVAASVAAAERPSVVAAGVVSVQVVAPHSVVVAEEADSAAAVEATGPTFG
jgi:hypothetical protein